MRKLRAVERKDIAEIARTKSVSYRQAYQAVADIVPGKQYTEEELRGNREPEDVGNQASTETEATEQPAKLKDDETDETGEEEDGDDVFASRQISKVPSEPPEPSRIPKRQREQPPILVNSYEDVLRAAQVDPATLLTLLSEAYRAGCASLGEYLQSEVLPWMRLVTHVQRTFEHSTDLTDRISPEEFQDVLNKLVARSREYKEKYEDLKRKVDQLKLQRGR